MYTLLQMQIDGFNLILNAFMISLVCPCTIRGHSGLKVWYHELSLFINGLPLVQKYCKAELYVDNASYSKTQKREYDQELPQLHIYVDQAIAP